MVHTTISDTRLYDYLMLGFMVSGSIIAALIGITTMQMAFGYPETNNLDFELYMLHMGLYGNQMNLYQLDINRTMMPLCCGQYGEGQTWGDTRK